MAKAVTIGRANISMEAHAGKLILQVQKAEKSYKQSITGMIKSANRLKKSMAEVSKSIAKFSAVGLGAAGGLSFLTKEVLDSHREMQSLAREANVSFEAMKELSFASSALGIDVSTTSDAMKDLSLKIEDAASGGGVLVSFFEEVNQDAKEWINLDPAKQMELFTKELDKLGTSRGRFYADEVNESMLKLYDSTRQSGQSLKEFTDIANSLGAGASSAVSGNINNLYTETSKLKLLFDELSQTTLGVLASAFTDLFASATASAKKYLTELGGGNITEGIVEAAKKFASVILNAVALLATGIQKILNKIAPLIGVEQPDTSKIDSQITGENLKLKYILEDIETLRQSNNSFANQDNSELDELNKKLVVQKKLIADLYSDRSKTYTFADDFEKSIDKMQAKIGSFTAPASTSSITSPDKETIKTAEEAAKLQADMELTALKLLNDKKLAAYLKYGNDRELISFEMQQREHDQLDQVFEDGLLDYETYWAAKAVIDEKYAKQSTQMQINEQMKTLAAQQSSLDVLSQAAGIASTIVGSVNEDSSAAAKALFVLTQAVAFGQAIVNTELAAAKALSFTDSTDKKSAIANAQLMRTLGYASAGAILGTTVAGVFHDGGEIPTDGTYLMQGGEYVMNQDQTKKLMDGRLDNMGESSGTTTINAPMTIQGNVTDEKWFKQNLVTHRSTIADANNKAMSERPQKRKR